MRQVNGEVSKTPATVRMISRAEQDKREEARDETDLRLGPVGLDPAEVRDLALADEAEDEAGDGERKTDVAAEDQRDAGDAEHHRPRVFLFCGLIGCMPP